MENKYIIRDGVRKREVYGELIAESTSYTPGRDRWIEFQLIRNPRGIYVVSRVGISLYYHRESCETVERNRLSAVSEEELDVRAVPCGKCRPPSVAPENGLFPETPRYWSAVCHEPRGVIESLIQYDRNNTEYMTNVARRLLEQASEVDEGIRREYLEDIIH